MDQGVGFRGYAQSLNFGGCQGVHGVLSLEPPGALREEAVFKESCFFVGVAFCGSNGGGVGAGGVESAGHACGTGSNGRNGLHVGAHVVEGR